MSDHPQEPLASATPLSYATPSPGDTSRLLPWLGVAGGVVWFPVLMLACGGIPRTPGILLVLLPTLPVAALALGLVARRRASPSDAAARGLGTTAMILGVTELALLLFAALLLPSIGRAREPANRVKCASNLRQIGQAVQIYANEHGGRLPPALDALLTSGDLTSECFVCPSSNDERATGATTQALVQNFKSNRLHCSYVYVGAALPTGSITPAHVLAYEPLANHAGHPRSDGGDGMNVLYGDGSVTWTPKPEADRLIAELNAGHNPPRPRAP